MLGGRNHWGSPWRLPTTKWQIFSGSGDKLRTIVSTHLLSDKEDSAFSGAQSKKKRLYSKCRLWCKFPCGSRGIHGGKRHYEFMASPKRNDNIDPSDSGARPESGALCSRGLYISFRKQQLVFY